MNEAGDYLIPLQEGAIREDHIRAEIGELLVGAKEGRRSATSITLFKSLGLACEDLAAANYIYKEAIRTNKGTHIDF
ncbi:ornithine cyclodeaminase [compost metagenome]